MEPWDLPITKGLQESIHAFRRLDEANAVEPLLEQIAIRPQMDVAFADETVERFPEILGGISVALAKTFQILDPESRGPHTDDWERAFRIFDTLL